LIPYRVAYSLAWVAERVMKMLRRKDYLLSTDAIYLSNIFGKMDSGKARRELHWQPRPLNDTVRESVEWFGEREARS
jgi:dihydroflavonol-4-reductase